VEAFVECIVDLTLTYLDRAFWRKINVDVHVEESNEKQFKECR